MNKMSFKSTAITWPILFIALYRLSQFAEAEKLPEIPLKETVECLREYIGEKVIPRSFREMKKEPLSYGEYLGNFCKEQDIDKLEKRVSNDHKEHGEEVVACMKKKNLGSIYKDFHDFGEEEIEKARLERLRAAYAQERGDDISSAKPLLSDTPTPDYNKLDEDDEDDDDEIEDKNTTITKDGSRDTTAGSQASQRSPSKDTILKDDKRTASQIPVPSKDKVEASQVPQSLPFKSQEKSVLDADQSVEDNSDDEDDDPLDPKKYSDLSKFAVGLCFKYKTVQFDELEEQSEKGETFQCLKTCTKIFFDRINNILNSANDQITTSMTKKTVLLSKAENENKTLSDQSTISDKTESSSNKKALDANKEQTPENDAISDSLLEQLHVSLKDYLKEIKTFKDETEMPNLLTFEYELQENIKKKKKIAREIAKQNGGEHKKEDEKKEPEETFENVESITDTGIKYLNTYSRIYSVDSKYLDEYDIESDEDLDQQPSSKVQQTENQDAKPNENNNDANDDDDEEEEETFDSKLRHSFIFYKSCSVRQCYMEPPKSVPMYKFIHDEAENVPEASIDIESRLPKEKVDLESRFYQVLTGKYPDIGDEDDYSQSQQQD